MRSHLLMNSNAADRRSGHSRLPTHRAITTPRDSREPRAMHKLWDLIRTPHGTETPMAKNLFPFPGSIGQVLIGSRTNAIRDEPAMRAVVSI
jgi:hypothetical protein